MPDVAMPRLSDSMEEGTILKWLKRDGDEVAVGDELVEIETDKANMTYEAEQAGVLSIVAPEGSTLPVGQRIAEIGNAPAEREPGPAGEPAAEGAERAPEPAGEPAADRRAGDDSAANGGGERADLRAPEPPQVAETPAAQSQPVAGGDAGAADGGKASPVARRMARELGVPLGELEGTGPGGRIVKADVRAAAGIRAPEAVPAPPAEAAAPAAAAQSTAAAPARADSGTAKGDVEVRELSKLQQTVARRMAESKATAPDFVVALDADMEEAVGLRAQLKTLDEGPAPSLNDFVIKAAGLALREFPRANGAYRDGRFELYSRVNVGIAVAARDALVVPTIFDADAKPLSRIAAEARQLAERVRSGSVTPPELSGGTFTVSNLGMYGMRRITPVINPPQAAILGVGEVVLRPVVRDGEVRVRHVVDLTLVCDHRILYGADAAQFLARIRHLLEQPLHLLAR